MSLEKLKFLEKAVQVACDEIEEEMDAILEGSDLDRSNKVIRSILNDLRESIVNPDVTDYDVETPSVVLSTRKIRLEDFVLKPYTRLFYPGETVKIKSGAYFFQMFPKWLPCEMDDQFRIGGNMGYALEGSIATVLDVFPDANSKRATYVIQTDGMKFISHESGIEEI